MKLVITLSLLAGGDALDIAVIYDVYPGHICTIVYNILVEWIKLPNIGGIDMNKYVYDVEAMISISK